MKAVLFSFLFLLISFHAFGAIQDISAGQAHSCAIAAGQAYCWGAIKEDSWDVDQGQTKVPPLKNPRMIIASLFSQTCAIDDDGVKCWGNKSESIKIPPLTDIATMAMGGFNFFVVAQDKVVTLGYLAALNVPPTLKHPTQIVAGNNVTCAIDNEGLKCWAIRSFNGELDIPELKNPRFVALRGLHVCAIDDLGVHCWGDNYSGQLDVPALKNPKSVSVGMQNTCAIDDDGIKCWGDDTYGLVSKTPEMKNVKKISVGTYHACATDGQKVVCWGNNENQRTSVPDFLAGVR